MSRLSLPTPDSGLLCIEGVEGRVLPGVCLCRRGCAKSWGWWAEILGKGLRPRWNSVSYEIADFRERPRGLILYKYVCSCRVFVEMTHSTISLEGLVGMIVPTGIATDNPDKRCVLTANDFALMNPNTRTTPPSTTPATRRSPNQRTPPPGYHKNGLHSVDLWEALLALQVSDSMQDFGSLSSVTALDADRWAGFTLATLIKTSGRPTRRWAISHRYMSAHSLAQARVRLPEPEQLTREVAHRTQVS